MGYAGNVSGLFYIFFSGQAGPVEHDGCEPPANGLHYPLIAVAVIQMNRYGH